MTEEEIRDIENKQWLVLFPMGIFTMVVISMILQDAADGDPGGKPPF